VKIVAIFLAAPLGFFCLYQWVAFWRGRADKFGDTWEAFCIVMAISIPYATITGTALFLATR
jgi:hypothetical protein